jgi:hypothetical protein
MESTGPNPYPRAEARGAGGFRAVVRLAAALGVVFLVCVGGAGVAQVETHVPAPVAGAKSVTIERILHETLDAYGVDNGFEIYPGTHTGDAAFRFQDHVMPFFSRHLESSAKR